MSAPLLLVVTTLGRVGPLRILLDSALPQLRPGDAVVVVAQGRLEEVRALVAERAAGTEAVLRTTTSPRGASVGRNTGLRAVEVDPETIVMFPNDTTWYPPGALDAIRAGLGEAPAGAVAVRTTHGARLALPAAGSALDAHTVWQVIEMGLVARHGILTAVGGFDPRLGTGAATPWQAGEVTDLLLRMLRATPSLAHRFVWLHARATQVGGVAEGAGLSPAERAWKLRAYGRGIGFVYRRHRYPLARRLAFVTAGLLVGVRRRREYPLRAGGAAFLGRLEGVTGRILGEASRPAVQR